jgi:hypothetical protein
MQEKEKLIEVDSFKSSSSKGSDQKKKVIELNEFNPNIQ